MEQLTQACTAIAEACLPQGLSSTAREATTRRAAHRETREQFPWTTARESPRATTKTQHGQKQLTNKRF